MGTNKMNAADLKALLPRLELGERAAIIGGCDSVSAAVAELTRAALLVEAARLCAHALPARERVWWAARCASATAGADLPEADRQACALAEQWVRNRSDETRRAAMETALRAGCTSPEAWVAVAAFWSGDSMAPVGQPAVPPAPHLAGTAVSGSVILASVRGQPAKQPDRLRLFLGSVLDIANGGAGHLEREAA